MQKKLVLKLKRNYFYIVISFIAYLAIVTALCVIVMPWWLLAILLSIMMSTCGIAFVRDACMLIQPIRSVEVYLDKSGNLHWKSNSIPIGAKWAVTWRSRKLVVVYIKQRWWQMSRSIWMNPSSLQDPEKHRYLRMFTRFSSTPKV